MLGFVLPHVSYQSESGVEANGDLVERVLVISYLTQCFPYGQDFALKNLAPCSQTAFSISNFLVPVRYCSDPHLVVSTLVITFYFEFESARVALAWFLSSASQPRNLGASSNCSSLWLANADLFIASFSK